MGCFRKIEMFVGTYTEGTKGVGIYYYTLDLLKGETILQSVTASPNPSFLARAGNRLLAVNEHIYNGKVSLFEIASNKLCLLDMISSFGGHPCHVTCTMDGMLTFVSNYTGGSLQLYALSASRDKLFSLEGMEYEGNGPHVRQKSPHIHAAFWSPDGQLYVSDLGSDQIYIYDLDRQANRLILR